MTFMGGAEGARDIDVEVTTSGYRVSGIVQTRFDRIAAILNNLDHTHLVIHNVTIRELYDEASPWNAASATVPLDEILFLAASVPANPSLDAIVVPKRPFAATVGLPPFRLAGTMYMPESLESPATVVTVNPDDFIVMTDVRVSCPPHPALNATYPLVAFQRRRLHVFSAGIPDEAGGDDPRHGISWE